MAITRKKKEEIVAKVKDLASKATTLVFVGFKGLSVAQQSEMRRALRAQDISYTVAKKSLLRRAVEWMPELEGEIALVSGSDELAPAREILTFVKKFPEQLSFAGGIFGGVFVDKEKIAAIAAIPGMETLRAMFAQIINSPRQRFAVALGKVAETKQ